MAEKNFYQRLGVEPTAAVDEIRRAFRGTIARYHPDKMQHLGCNFESTASEMTAECTEAYRTLSNPTTRAEYDAWLGLGMAARHEGRFEEDRVRANVLIRHAAIGRISDALRGVIGSCDELPVRGFDVSCMPVRAQVSQVPCVLGLVVATVDSVAVKEAFIGAMRLRYNGLGGVCVLLMGSTLWLTRDADTGHSGQRRIGATPRCTVVPVNIATWSAHVPADAPAPVTSLIRRLWPDGV